jgi:AAA family ATP:ADP antiporter
MYARLRKFLDVRPGEGAAVLYTFTYVAIAVGSFLLAKAIRNGLFLQQFGASKLAYVYVAVPIVLSILVPLYGAFAGRFGLRKVITASLLFLAFNVLAFWWALTHAPRPWLAAAFYVWVNCYGVIAPVQAWTFANAVFDTRQARRLFGLVGSGASFGAIVGGLLARVLVEPLGTVRLLVVLAGLIAAAAVVVNLAWHVRRRDPDRARARRVPFRDTLSHIAANSYLRRIALLVASVAIVTQWTGYQFQAAAALRFAGDADRLTRFFGDFNSVMGGVALAVQVLATGPALRRFGLGITILMLPVLLGGGVTAILLFGSLWAVVLTNAFDQGLRFSIDKATFELLYLPIPSSLRDNVKSTIDLIVNRLADALGGVLLGLMTAGFAVGAMRIPGLGLGVRGVAAVSLAFIAGWVAVAVALRRGYVDAIRESITQHRLDTERSSARVLDRSATQLLATRLQATEPAEILYALDVFRLEHRGATHPAVRGLLAYPDAEVRRRAIAVLDDAGDLKAVAEIEGLLDDPDPGVRADALVFLAHHAGVDPLMRIGTPEDFEDYSVQAGLVAFLGRESAWQNLDAARIFLNRMIEGEGPNGKRAKVEAARLIAQLPRGFEDELARLLVDDDGEVVRAALASAARYADASLVEEVLPRVAEVELRDAALEALAGMGPAIVPDLRAVLEDRTAQAAVRQEIPRVLSSIGGRAAQAALLENLFEPDVALRTKIIAGLSRLHARHRDLPVDRQTIEMQLMLELMGHYRSYQILGTLGATFDTNDPVAQGLRHAMEQEQERIFRLLDPLLPDQDMKSVYVALRSESRSLRANALELLDNVLSPHLRDKVVPLFDGQVTLAERIAMADRFVGMAVESPEQAVLAMLASEDAWLKACGVFAVGALRLQGLRDRVAALTDAAEPLLRQTARDALARLDGTRVQAGAAPRVAAPEPHPMGPVGESFGVG